MKQIQISGVRMENGHLKDVHEPMDEEDYVLLEWALEKCKPGVITLEYFRYEDSLREQIFRIGEIIATPRYRTAAG